MRRVRLFSRAILAVLFMTAGALHFVKPVPFERIVPPPLPAGFALKASGALEIAGGVGLLFPATRAAAAAVLLGLLVLVWPANVFMALSAEHFRLPAWLLWLRVALQVPLLGWV